MYLINEKLSMKTCRSPTLNMTKLIADLKDIFRLQ